MASRPTSVIIIDSDDDDGNDDVKDVDNVAATATAVVADNDGGTVRLAASKVALLLGLHEFGDIGEAILECVYQDREELLERDAAKLELRVVSEDQRLEELIATSGRDLAPQLREIWQWTTGRRDGQRPTTLAAAHGLVRDVEGLVARAQKAKALAGTEAAEVQRQLTQRIRQSVGQRNENVAIRAYEQATGSIVRATNAHLYVLSFPNPEPIDAANVDYAAVEREIRVRVITRDSSSDEAERENDRDNDDGEEVEHDNEQSDVLFTICGMVDGIAEALDIISEDDWRMVPIVVEVKNRMRAFRVPPPLHDHIQMAIYMKMTNVGHGDLVQCLNSDKTNIHVTRVSLDAYPLRVSSREEAANATRTTDGGIWSAVLLPRLYAIVGLIRHLRVDDLRRLVFLNATASERIRILQEHCDFL